jgi:hypothetical protein
MRDTITRVKGLFPAATVIVVGYYQIISSDTPLGGPAPESSQGSGNSHPPALNKATRKLANERLQIEGKDQQVPGRLEILLQNWPANSIAFLKTAEGCHKWAIVAGPNETPGDPKDRGGEPACPAVTLPEPAPDAILSGSRVFLAVTPNRPEYAYGGKKKHLWSLPVGFLCWTRDQMYRPRKRLCDSHYKGQFQNYAVCLVNPAAHPNSKGANAYACSIVSDPRLKCEPGKQGILDKAWMRSQASQPTTF